MLNVVGALNTNKKKSKDSADNSLVTDWATGIFKIHKMRDTKGRVGFDYTGDGTIDISAERTTSEKKKPSPYISGTSVAAPVSLVRGLKNK